MEVGDDLRSLYVYFLGTVAENLLKDNVLIVGGQRIRNLQVTGLQVECPEDSQAYLKINLDQLGDFSTYDPELGRMVFPRRQLPKNGVWVSYHYGFSADIGGGEYDRPLLNPDEIGKYHEYALYKVSQNSTEYYQTITEAILQWQREKPRHAVIEIIDSGVYVEQIDIPLESNQTLQLRAANRTRPVIRILDWRTSYGDALNVTVKPGSSFTLDGLLITGRGVHVEGGKGIAPLAPVGSVIQKPPQLVIRHCTLVLGWSLHCDCEPRRSTEPSLELCNTDAHTVIEHSIVGSIEVNQDEVQTDLLPIHIYDTIIDGTSVEWEAMNGVGGTTAHVQLTMARCTVFGQIHVHTIESAENCIFNGKISVSRQQLGCIRFCYVTPNSRTPHRYNCQPDLVEQAVTEEALRQQERDRVQPQFNSTRYGTPTYCQLADTCAEEIKHGADDESEMGVFHNLYQSQKAANLRTRLDEYTPAGMQAAIIYIN